MSACVRACGASVATVEAPLGFRRIAFLSFSTVIQYLDGGGCPFPPRAGVRGTDVGLGGARRPQGSGGTRWSLSM